MKQRFYFSPLSQLISLIKKENKKTNQEKIKIKETKRKYLSISALHNNLAGCSSILLTWQNKYSRYGK